MTEPVGEAGVLRTGVADRADEGVRRDRAGAAWPGRVDGVGDLASGVVGEDRLVQHVGRVGRAAERASLRAAGELPEPPRTMPGTQFAGTSVGVVWVQTGGRSMNPLSPGPGKSWLPAASVASGVFGPVGSQCTFLPKRFSPGGVGGDARGGVRLVAERRAVGVGVVEAVAGVRERRVALVEGDVDQAAVLERRATSRSSGCSTRGTGRRRTGRRCSSSAWSTPGSASASGRSGCRSR